MTLLRSLTTPLAEAVAMSPAAGDAILSLLAFLAAATLPGWRLGSGRPLLVVGVLVLATLGFDAARGMSAHVVGTIVNTLGWPLAMTLFDRARGGGR